MKFDVLRQHYGDKQYFKGDEREANAGDVVHLVRAGVLRPRAEDGLRSDGPTIGECVAAGYKASGYPPHGYASRSTDEEIAAAVAAEAGPPPTNESPAAPITIEPERNPAPVLTAPSTGEAETPTATKTEAMAATEKGAQAPDNKAAPKPDNKAAPKTANKSAS